MQYRSRDHLRFPVVSRRTRGALRVAILSAANRRPGNVFIGECLRLRGAVMDSMRPDLL